MYGSKSARLYDLQHAARGKDFRGEAALVEDHVRRRRPDAASLLDVACGTGAHLEVLGSSFPDTAGLEISEAMLALGHERLPSVPLHQGDMRDFDLGRRFDAVLCLFASIAYVDSAEELDATVATLAAHTTPGGVVAVEPQWFSETFLDGYVGADHMTVEGTTIARVTRSVRDGADAGVMEAHYTVAEPGAPIEHFVESHRFMLFSRARYLLAFARAGLDTEFVPGVLTGRGLFVGTAPA